MRLLIGLIAFLAWSGGSAYWYVCKVKGLCPEEDIPTIEMVASGEIPEGEEEVVLPLEDEVVADADASEEASDEVESDEPPLAEEPIAEEAIADEDIPAVTPPADLPDKYTILFAFAKPLISNQSKATSYMQEVASYLNAHPGAKVRVEGYTDDTAAKHKNQELGQKRAEAIADLLEKEGVPRDQMEIVSMGEANPVATNETPAGRKKNRRVEITVTQ